MSKPTMAKIINMPPNKTAMSPAKSGLLTRELNTKAGVPK